MIRHVWTVLARRVIIDQKTNSVTIIDAVEHIGGSGAVTVGAPPERMMLPLDTSLVTLWTREDPQTPTKGRARARLLTPDGEEALTSEYDVELTEHQRRRNVTNLQGFPYKTSGRAEWVIERELEDSSWEEVARIPVDLQFEIRAGNGSA